MIDPVSSPSLFAGAGSNASSGTKELGRDQFLQLLVAQLKHQDPMSPLEASEFAARLAQFSSVEQLTQLNDGLAALQASDHLQMLMSEASFTAGLVGKTVVTEGAIVEVTSEAKPVVHVNVGGRGGNGTLILRDAKGTEVARRELGWIEPGTQDLTLPGGLPEGSWTYELNVKDNAGGDVTVHRFTMGKVETVSFSNGNVLMRVAGKDIVLDSLVEILSK